MLQQLAIDFFQFYIFVGEELYLLVFASPLLKLLRHRDILKFQTFDRLLVLLDLLLLLQELLADAAGVFFR